MRLQHSDKAEEVVLMDCYQFKFVIWYIMLAIKRYHAQKMSVVEIRMLSWICDNPMRDKVKNKHILTKIGVTLWKRRSKKSTQDSRPIQIYECISLMSKGCQHMTNYKREGTIEKTQIEVIMMQIYIWMIKALTKTYRLIKMSGEESFM